MGKIQDARKKWCEDMDDISKIDAAVPDVLHDYPLITPCQIPEQEFSEDCPLNWEKINTILCWRQGLYRVIVEKYNPCLLYQPDPPVQVAPKLFIHTCEPVDPQYTMTRDNNISIMTENYGCLKSEKRFWIRKECEVFQYESLKNTDEESRDTRFAIFGFIASPSDDQIDNDNNRTVFHPHHYFKESTNSHRFTPNKKNVI